MIKVTEDMVTMLAPNAAAVSNAKKISQKNGFSKLCRSEDDTLLYGECSGSGKNPYIVSIDFINPENPVFRCSCPSRQFPCKHGLALLYEVLANKTFASCAVPQDILDKREKQTARAEKKKEQASEPSKKVNQAALAKKLKKQMEGLDLAGRFVDEILGTGLAALGGRAVSSYQTLAKQLGDYYLPGPQTMVNRILQEVQQLGKTADDAGCYRRITETVIQLHATVKKAKSFLGEKVENGQVLMEDSVLYDRLGTVWQLAQLRELGLYQENVSLVQLSFEIVFDAAKQEYDDIGWWIDLATGEVSKTENLRPVKALKYVKQDDTVFDCVSVPCLYYYPGEKNKRIRWEEFSMRSLTKSDLTAVRGFAGGDLTPIVKAVKNQIKNALSEKTVMALVAFSKIGKIGESYVLADQNGQTIELCDREGEEDSVVTRLSYLSDESMLENQVLAGQFFYDAAMRRIKMAPHAIVTESQIIRLRY